MSCWCSIWQSQLTPESDVQKCFNSHFKRYMGLPKCARVGSAVPRVQTVGTDYISRDAAPLANAVSPISPDCPPKALADAPCPGGQNTLPPLAAMPPLPISAPLPSAADPPSNSEAKHSPREPPLKKRHIVTWALQHTSAPPPAPPAGMLRSNSGSVSGTHQPSVLRREVGSLEATRSDAKYACGAPTAVAEQPCSTDPCIPGPHGDGWMSEIGLHLSSMAQHSTGSGWPQGWTLDRQDLVAPPRMYSGGMPGSCSHARAEFKKQVTRAQLMRSSSSTGGVPGSVQLAAALGAAPDCSSPHAMESTGTAVMQLPDGRDSGGSGSAVCGSSDVSGVCTAERIAAGQATAHEGAAVAAFRVRAAGYKSALRRGPTGASAVGPEGASLLNAMSSLPKHAGPPCPVTAGALMQKRQTQDPMVQPCDTEPTKFNPADKLQTLADTSEQEDAAVGLLCLRHHPACWGVVEPGFWHCKQV